MLTDEDDLKVQVENCSCNAVAHLLGGCNTYHAPECVFHQSVHVVELIADGRCCISFDIFLAGVRL